MPIPAAVERLLRDKEIEFGIEEQDPSLSSAVDLVQSTLLQDSSGKLQILYPAHTLIDLQAVQQATGRQLTALPFGEVQELCQQHGVESLPAVPFGGGLEILVDRRLLQATELKLYSGDDQSVIQMVGAQFQRIVEGATTGDFSISETHLDRGNLDAADDVEQITQSVANFTQLRIKERLEDTLEIPPLPETAQRIIKLRADPYADIKDLSDIVEADPPLAAQVVSWAASPYYAAPGKISSIHDAIVRVLGYDLVLNLSLGLALGKTLSLPKETARGFTPYWQQAVYGATAMEGLVSAIPAEKRPSIGMAYLSGLLHNFGYLVLAEVFPPHFSSLCKYQEANRNANHCHIERHLLGITRDQLGGWLMRLWEMPEEIAVAIRHQNEPRFDGEHAQYAQLLHVATRLLRRHGIGDAPVELISNDVYESLSLDPEKAKEIVESVVESKAELNEIASRLAA